MSESWRLRGYVLERLLGCGASGEVWRARVASTGEAVALKRLAVPDAEQLRRAHAEAAKLTVLEHPHLVRLHALVPDDGAAVLVLDLADGGSLADLLAARRLLTPGESITAIAPVAAALAHLHSVGVVHGDVSAANVLFTVGGIPLLADLGVARLTGDERDAESTPAYVDPAVALGGIPGPHSDVFMLGGVALHALTGVPPWPGSTAEEALARARDGRLGDVSRRLAESRVPDKMAAVVARALDLDPRLRGTAAELALDLRHSGTPVAVELAAGVARTPPREQTAVPPAPTETRPRVGGRHAALPPERPRGAKRGASLRVHTALSSRPGGRGGGAADPAAPTSTGSTSTGSTSTGSTSTGSTSTGSTSTGSTSTGSDASSPVPAAEPDRARPPFERPSGVVATAIGPGRPPPTSAVGPRPRPSIPRADRRGHLPRVVAVVCGVVVLAAAAAFGSLWWSRHGGADDQRAGGQVATQPRSRPAAQDASDWLVQLNDLDSLRAQAFARGDAALLRRVYPAGPLLRADTALLHRIVEPGCGLHGARTRYAQVQAAVRGSGAVLTVRATLPASRLYCHGLPAGTASGVGPVRLRLELTRTPGGLRIASQRRV